MKSVFKFFLVTSFLFGCKNDNLINRIEYLTNDSCKYWVRYNSENLKPYGMGYCICKDGIFKRFYTNDSSERILTMPPSLPKPVWNLLNDSIMEFGQGLMYRIIFLNSDSIILQNTKFPSRDYFRLHKDDDQITLPIPKSLKDTIILDDPFPDL